MSTWVKTYDCKYVRGKNVVISIIMNIIKFYWYISQFSVDSLSF